MVTTDTAVLPWSRPSLTADAPSPGGASRSAATGRAREIALEKPAGESSGDFQPFGKDGFSFLDLIDVINPLQHIPLIGTLYREITGDEIGPLPRIAGSTLFFGPVGAAFAGANVVVEEMSGQDVGGHIMTALRAGGVGLNTAAAETAPKHAVSVIAKTPAAAGTDAATGAASFGDDPVSAWARGELSYRAELARGRDLAQASRGRDVAEALSTEAAPTPATTPVPVTTDAEKLSWAERPLIGTPAHPAAFVTAAGPETMAPRSTIMAAAAPAAGAASTTSADVPDITRFTQALGLAEPATVSELAAETRGIETARPARAALAYEQAGRRASAIGRQQARAKSVSVAASLATTQPTSRPGRETVASSEGAVAPGGGWFAANMMQALTRYEQHKPGPASNDRAPGMASALN